MEHSILYTMERCYELERELLGLEAVMDDNQQALRQAKYNLRQVKEEQLNYGGSFRRFLDGFSGKRQEEEDNLSRNVAHSQNALDLLQREKEQLQRQDAELREERNRLPALQVLEEAALEDPETAAHWAALACRFYGEILLPLLKKTDEALMEYRKTQQGNRPGEILTPDKIQRIYAEPDIWGEKCKIPVQRLEKACQVLGKELTPGDYFRSPTSYLVAAAAIHNRRDRVNKALDQVTELRRKIERLLKE